MSFIFINTKKERHRIHLTNNFMFFNYFISNEKKYKNSKKNLLGKHYISTFVEILLVFEL